MNLFSYFFKALLYMLAVIGFATVLSITQTIFQAPQKQAAQAIQAEAAPPIAKPPERFTYEDISGDGHAWIMTDTKSGRQYYMCRGYGMVEITNFK